MADRVQWSVADVAAYLGVLYVGSKPCTGHYTTTYTERRKQAVQEQERKRIVRLFGKDAT